MKCAILFNKMNYTPQITMKLQAVYRLAAVSQAQASGPGLTVARRENTCCKHNNTRTYVHMHMYVVYVALVRVTTVARDRFTH